MNRTIAALLAVVALVASMMFAGPAVAEEPCNPNRIGGCQPPPLTLEDCLAQSADRLRLIDQLYGQTIVLSNNESQLSYYLRESERTVATQHRTIRRQGWELNRKFWRIYRLENRVASLRQQLRALRQAA